MPGSPRPPTKIVMIPSVSGGIGHISRTAALARALWRIDPSLEIDYLLDTDRLRPFNIDATRRMGFRPRFLPPRNRDNRDAVVRACLDDADIVVDDCCRYLLPLRQAVPDVRWVTLAMHPVGDELFMDWPFMVQMDAVIWPYAPLVGLPPELDCVADKVTQTGPFLETEALPGKECGTCPARLAGRRAHRVLYAPRGFPFGREFGHRVLAGLFGAVQTLRRGAHPDLQLLLLAVTDPAELRAIPGVPDVAAGLGPGEGRGHPGRVAAAHPRRRRGGRRRHQHDARGGGRPHAPGAGARADHGSDAAGAGAGPRRARRCCSRSPTRCPPSSPPR